LNWIDILGLKWVQSNKRTVSVEASASAYAIVGGSASIKGQETRADCCNSDTGEIIEDGYYQLNGNAELALGFGGGFTAVFGGSIFGGVWKGPQIQTQLLAISHTQKCGETKMDYKLHGTSVEANFTLSVSGGKFVGGGVNGKAFFRNDWGIGYRSKTFYIFGGYEWGYEAKVTAYLGAIAGTYTLADGGDDNISEIPIYTIN
jgi:hypothetical protein